MKDKINMMEIFTPSLLLFLFCAFLSSQGHSSSLPPSEEESYSYLISTLSRMGDKSGSGGSCDDSSNSTILFIRCANNTLIPQQMNIISLTIRGLSAITSTRWEFPTLRNFTYLQHLVLSNANIEDTIPDYLGNLSTLITLDMSYNMLKGSIPNNLGQLNNLVELSLSHNFLSGSIPDSFGGLSSLNTLDLSMNMLSGSIPRVVWKMGNLEKLNLGSNNLSDTLPAEIGKLVNLTQLKVASNNLIGAIPREYGQLQKMTHFSVAGNNLRDRIPEFIENWTMLSTLELMGNNFEGAVPPGIFALTALQTLWVTNLTNSGFPFPSLAKLKHMKSLIMRKCGLTGRIGDDIGDMSKLFHLDLSFNELIGGIPDSLSSVTSLFDLSVAGNKLNESFPDWVVDDTYGRLADLSDNNFTLTHTLDTPTLSHKNLFGCCSSYTNLSDGSSLKDMTSDPYQLMEAHCPHGQPKRDSLYINCGGSKEFELYESDNASSSVHISSQGKWAYSCSGHFMASSPGNYAGYFLSSTGLGYTQKTTCAASPLFETARLCPVSLTYYGFCLHSGDYIVQLHFAEIVYNEDEDYGSLKKRVFDVYIQGELKVADLNIKDRAGAPNRPWNETHKVKVEGDSLLKIQLLWAGKGAITDDPLMNGPLISAITVTPAPKPKKLTPWQIVLIVLACLIFAVLLILVICWKMGLLENKEWLETRIELRGDAFITVKYIIDATQNFKQHEIGKGGFGTVYKVKADNQIVAVKKLHTGQSTTVAADFRQEIYALKSLENENLIKFFDSFSRKDLHLLVYEFMENGGLDSALLSDENSERKLDWKKRYDICTGIARGLRYMHEDKALKIIHRDLKASNVLLDENLKAKISDFGLAKIYDENNCTDDVQGVHGYTAPEYGLRGIYSDKTDVFSYGVLLLEIMSGKSNAIDSSSGERVFLLDSAYDFQKKGKLMDLIDKKLKRDFNQKQAETIMNIAIACTNVAPASRPKMCEVVDVLDGKISYNKLMTPAIQSDNKCPHCNGTGTILTSNCQVEAIEEEISPLQNQQ